MKNLLIILVLLVNFEFVFGQENFKYPADSDYPKLQKNARNVTDFVPENWEVISKVFGDLNGDKTLDCVLVVKGKYAKFLNKNKGLGDDIFDTNPRMLVILFKNATKNYYEIGEQSNTFIKIPDSPTMSEPFQLAKIKKGVLELSFEQWYSAGTWYTSTVLYRFRYQNQEFVLIGADKTESQRNTGETETRSYNFLTKKIKITTGNYSDDVNKKVVWKNFSLDKLKTFRTFKEPFSWEIETDYFL